jgi:hypothetical protein
MNFFTISDFIFVAGLHSELTTQGQVTPKRIKRENKSRHGNPYQPPCFDDLP